MKSIGQLSLCLFTLCLLNGFSFAQELTYRSSMGLVGVSSPWQLERDDLPIARPRFDVVSMPTKSIGQPVRRFRYDDRNLGIQDRVEIVFLSELRPYRVRLELKTATPLEKLWRQRLERLFRYLDRDNDQYLNAFESEFLFSNKAIQQLVNGGFAYPTAADPGRSLSDFDRDRDDKISIDEFLAAYRESAANLIGRRTLTTQDPYAERMTNRLFELLDANKDQKLSEAEVGRLQTILKANDLNEDECLIVEELFPGFFQDARLQPTQLNRPIARTNPDLFVFEANKIPESIVESILVRYDRDKNLRLSASEVKFTDPMLRFLDKNRDGEIALSELMNWVQGPIDGEYRITLGNQAADTRLEPINHSKSVEPKATAVSTTDANRSGVIIPLGNQKLSISAIPVSADPVFAAPISDQFSEAAGKKGYIVEKDLIGPQFQLMRLLFDMIDRNSDGKMTRTEYDRFMALQGEFRGLSLTLQTGTETPSLYVLIDQNRDGRLSLNEIRAAFAHLSKLEPNFSGTVSRNAIAPDATIQFGRSSAVQNQFANFSYNPRVVSTTEGPVWYQRMDRNGDGEVSRKEFLGDASQFDRIDTNRDDRINRQEAEAFDAILRKKK